MTDAPFQRNNPADLDHWFSEIRKAAERIRKFPDRNGRSNHQQPLAAMMRWVLNFAHIHLDNLSEGDLSNLNYEYLFIARIHETHPGILWNLPVKIMTREELSSAQRWLQTAIGQIQGRQPVKIVVPRTELSLNYSSKFGRWLAFEIPTESSEGPSEIYALLKEHIDKLLLCKCEGCEQPLFLRDRHNQDYCSHRCKWRHAQRNRPDRTIPPERFGKRGRLPGSMKPKGATDGQKKEKQAAATRRPHSRRVSTKRP